jgi:hypothetical protein
MALGTTVRRFIINSDIHVIIPNAAPERKKRIPLSDSFSISKSTKLSLDFK